MKKILNKDQASNKHQAHLMSLLSTQEKIERLQLKLKHREKTLRALDKEKQELESQIDALSLETESAH